MQSGVYSGVSMIQPTECINSQKQFLDVQRQKKVINVPELPSEPEEVKDEFSNVSAKLPTHENFTSQTPVQDRDPYGALQGVVLRSTGKQKKIPVPFYTGVKSPVLLIEGLPEANLGISSLEKKTFQEIQTLTKYLEPTELNIHKTIEGNFEGRKTASSVVLTKLSNKLKVSRERKQPLETETCKEPARKRRKMSCDNTKLSSLYSSNITTKLPPSPVVRTTPGLLIQPQPPLPDPWHGSSGIQFTDKKMAPITQPDGETDADITKACKPSPSVVGQCMENQTTVEDDAKKKANKDRFLLLLVRLPANGKPGQYTGSGSVVMMEEVQMEETLGWHVTEQPMEQQLVPETTMNQKDKGVLPDFELMGV